MPEIFLFIVVGAICIAAAAMMLLSENAVHSALFLILNFFGVAFLYLMLNAPFLALVQIAVYAGAIMVLFLFVIMLLGAERTGPGATQRFRWLAPLGMGLAVFFLVIVGWALTQGQIDNQSAAPRAAQVRFIHAAVPPEVAEADSTLPGDRVFALLLDGEIVDDRFVPGEVSEFLSLSADGSHVVSLRAPEASEDLFAVTLEPESDSVTTYVVGGESDLEAFAVPASETPGLVIINAYAALPSVSIGNLQNELFDDSRELLPIVDVLPYGTATEPLIYPPGVSTRWVVYQTGRTDAVASGVTRWISLRLSEVANPQPSENGIIVLMPERLTDNSLRMVAERLDTFEGLAYGSPESVGMVLFTDYMLPLQLVAMLLLAAMVGVIVMTYRGEHEPKPSRATRRKVSRPLTSVITSQTGTDLNAAPQLPERTEQPAGD
jgi:NADH-quinone oxidoreductase subunit J